MECTNSNCQYNDQKMTDSCAKGDPPDVANCAQRAFSPRSEVPTMHNIIDKNWIKLLNNTRNLLGKSFINNGDVYTYAGLVYGIDDYYYLMANKAGENVLLSCVGSFQMHHFYLLP